MRHFTEILCLTAVMVCVAASCGRQEGSKEENPVIEAIMSRRSIRKYQDKAVPRDLLAKIADCGLMGQNMMLAAHSLGLGTCCLGGPVDLLTKSEAARPYYEALGFSEGYSLKYILAVGWPEEAPDARPRDEGKVRFVEFE